MGAAMEMVRDWGRVVKGIFNNRLHGHQINALAEVSFAMAQAGHCHSGRVAAMMPSARGATIDSRRRRIERLLSNDRLDAGQAMQWLAQEIVQPWRGRPLILILDETPKPIGGGLGVAKHGDALCWMQVSLAYRKRALPLACICYRTGQLPCSQPQLVLQLLEAVVRRIPCDCPVTLLADRGLCWVKIIDFCTQAGWHYVLRLQRQTAFRTHPNDNDPIRSVAKLAPRPGSVFYGTGELFHAAGWRRCNVAAVWERRCKEPWLLVTDLPASYSRCRGYAKRVWCEQMHRDEKSSGLNFSASHVTDATHAHRLWLLIALALLLAISTGSYVLKNGLRRELESRRRRLLSLFQLGIRWLRECLVNLRSVPIQLHLYPP